MNETAKTSIFILLAAALIAGAMYSRPKLNDFKADETVGKPLFPQFTDPLAIKSLEIIKLDATGERNDFRITEVNGIWSIPSHDNYPADAKDQMGRVAEALTDLKVLEVIQPEGSGVDAIAFQTQYGVIDPASDSASLGDDVGISITLGGANNATLVNLIVGKEVTRHRPLDEENDSPGGLRYVRIANQSPVYVVSIDPSQFSTNFDQWIEKNLLDISAFDIKEFFVDQYSFSVEFALTNRGLQEIPKLSPIGDMTLGYDGSAVGTSKWSLIQWMAFEGQNSDYKERQLEQGRELDTDTLDSMMSALNDLKIVSVLKKPAELASTLREGTSFEDIAMTAVMEASMQETGFWLVEMFDLKGDSEKTKVQLLSNEGDLQLRLKNGVVYHLRFGDLTGTESELATEDSFDEMPVMGVNRYLFITAEFDPALILEPELKPIPEIPEEGEEAELAELKQVSEMVEKMNQREQERYDAEIESGKKRAAELSARFADWYYVISEDVYKKIHLAEGNVFRIKSEAPDFGMPWDGGIPGLPAMDLSPSVDHLPDLPGSDVLNFEESEEMPEPVLETMEEEE